jgi:WD40 repeat protein
MNKKYLPFTLTELIGHYLSKIYINTINIDFHTDRLVSILQNGKTFVTISFNEYIKIKYITLYEDDIIVEMVELQKTLTTPYVEQIAVSSNGKIIICGSMGGEIYIIDIEKLTITELINQDDTTGSIIFSRDEKTVIVSSFDGTINWWDLENKKCIKTMDYPDPLSMSLSPCERYIIFDTFGGLRALDIVSEENKEILYKCIYNRTFGEILWDTSSTFLSHRYIITAQCINCLINILTVDIQNNFALCHINTIIDRIDKFRSCVISPSGKFVISISDKNMKLWDTKSGNYITTIVSDMDFPHSAIFSPDEKFILITGKSITGKIKICYI